MVILEEGFENASIAKIAKRMEVNPSLLIHYFSTKEEMIKELIDSILDHYRQEFLPALEEIVDPEARLSYLLESLVVHKYRESTEDAVYYSCYALLFRDPHIKLRFREVYKYVCELVASELQRAKDAAVIQVSDPLLAAYMMICMAEGMSFYHNIVEAAFPDVVEMLQGCLLQAHITIPD